MVQDNKKTKMIEVSLFEAALIKKLRRYDFGEFVVTKLRGEPRRIDIVGKEMLSEKDGETLVPRYPQDKPR